MRRYMLKLILNSLRSEGEYITPLYLAKLHSIAIHLNSENSFFIKYPLLKN